MQDRAGPVRGAVGLPRADGQGRVPHPSNGCLTKETKANFASRDFRTNYTNAYKVLYQDSTPPLR